MRGCALRRDATQRTASTLYSLGRPMSLGTSSPGLYFSHSCARGRRTRVAPQRAPRQHLRLRKRARPAGPNTRLRQVVARALAAVVVVAVHVQHLRAATRAQRPCGAAEQRNAQALAQRCAACCATHAAARAARAARPGATQRSAGGSRRAQAAAHACCTWPCLLASHGQQAGDDALREARAQHDGIILLVHKERVLRVAVP